MEWIVYYHTGETFNSDMGNPADAPAHGVQFILSQSDVGWVCLKGADYYYYRHYADGFGEWCKAMEISGLLAQVMDNVSNMERILQGLTIRQQNFDALERRVKFDLAKLRDI